MLTLPREGRTPSIMRCDCGNAIQLPAAHPSKGSALALSVANWIETKKNYGTSPERSRAIQQELAGKVWR
jgi:hypothetical protein